MPNFAAIDIGTNSTKITAASVEGEHVRVLSEKVEITRLGKGVDATRRFADDAVERTLGALRHMTDDARRLGVKQIRAGATSAMRDAQNGEEFRRRASEIIGGEVEIVSGDREAQLTFLGAMSDPDVSQEGRAGKLLAFDIGGGSTELIVGTHHGPERFRSIDIGALRVTERALHTDPPTESEIAGARRGIEEELKVFDTGAVGRVVGIGGTAVTVASMLRPHHADPQGALVTLSQLGDLVKRLADMTVAERRHLPGLDPARADVIVGGMLIIERVLDRCACDEYVVSTRGVRYGLLLEMGAGSG